MDFNSCCVGVCLALIFCSQLGMCIVMINHMINPLKILMTEKFLIVKILIKVTSLSMAILILISRHEYFSLSLRLTSGYASQHIWCLSQARINSRVVPGRASSIKWWEWQRLGRQLVRMGWQSIRIIGVSDFVIFTLLQ